MINSLGMYDVRLLQQLNGAETQTLTAGGSKSKEDSKIDFSSDYAGAETVEEAEKDFLEAASALDETQKVEASGLTKEEIEEKLEELKDKREKIEEEMEEIEEEIEQLTEEAEKNIKEAAAKQKEANEEYDEEAQSAVQKNIEAYVEANKEGGEGMTREELQQNIKDSLPDKPNLAEALANLTAANEAMDQIDSKLGDLNSKILEANVLDTEIGGLEGEYQQAEEAEQQAASNKCCDPIGFTAGEGKDAAKYDFITDDGNFDSTSDFLGASGQWSAMQGLDADRDNTVTIDELKAGNIKAVKTGADGKQSIVDLAEEFGDDFSIDLNSYKEGGSHSAVDTTSDADGDGIADQQLLGTFKVNAAGQTLNGYNTLDDNDWLSSSYGVQADSSLNPFENSSLLNPGDFSEELQLHVNFFNTYTELNEENREQLNGAYKEIGFEDEDIEGINTKVLKQADAETPDETENADTEDGSQMTQEEKEEEEKRRGTLAA